MSAAWALRLARGMRVVVEPTRRRQCSLGGAYLAPARRRFLATETAEPSRFLNPVKGSSKRRRKRVYKDRPNVVFGSTGFSQPDRVSRPEEEQFFKLSGASKFRDGDLDFIFRRLNDLDGDEEEGARYLNSLLITDLKKNSRYTKVLWLHEVFSSRFNHVNYSTAVRLLASKVKGGQAKEMVRTRMFKEFLAAAAESLRCGGESRQYGDVLVGLAALEAETGGGLMICPVSKAAVARVIEGVPEMRRVDAGRLAKVLSALVDLGEVKKAVKTVRRIDSEMAERLVTESSSLGISSLLLMCSSMSVRPESIVEWVEREAEFYFGSGESVRWKTGWEGVAEALASWGVAGRATGRAKAGVGFMDRVKEDAGGMMTWAQRATLEEKCSLLRSVAICERVGSEGEALRVLWASALKEMAEAEVEAEVEGESEWEREGEREGEGAGGEQNLAKMAQAYAAAEILEIPLELATPEMYRRMEDAKAADKSLEDKRKRIRKAQAEIMALLEKQGMRGELDVDPRPFTARMQGTEGPAGLPMGESDPGFLRIDIANAKFQIAFEVITADQRVRVLGGGAGGRGGGGSRGDLDGLTKCKLALLRKLDWRTTTIDLGEWEGEGKGKGKGKGKEAEDKKVELLRAALTGAEGRADTLEEIRKGMTGFYGINT